MKRLHLITLVIILSAFIITADAYGAPNRKPEKSHDVAVTNMSAPSNCVQGDTVPVVITIENQGNHDEAFEVTLTDTTDGKEIGRRLVKLSGGGEGGIDEVADLIFTGESPGPQQFGNYVYHGDVNGDGYDDLLVTASRYNECQGRAYLYYGGMDMDVSADMVFTGENAGDYFSEGGYLGDVNGDNFPDVILGAFGYNSRQGRVYIYYGGPDMDENPDVTIDGESGVVGNFGRTCTAGDVNGDGYEDLFVGAIGYNAGRGRIYLYYGGDPMDGICDVTFTGENNHDEFGSGIEVGDVDNDGRADIFVGARRYNRSRGRVYLYWGKAKASMSDDVDLTFEGESNQIAFGGDDIAVGYINNDDYGDIAICAYGWPNNENKGRSYLYYGNNQGSMDTTCDHTFSGIDNGAMRQFMTIGDFNNDSYGDFVVGGWGYNNSQGRVWLYFGGPANCSTDVAFNWDTTKASTGEHTLKAEIVPVAGEKDTADNTQTATVNVKLAVNKNNIN